MKAKRLVPRRDKLTRKKRWELLDEDRDYKGVQLDPDVLAEEIIETIEAALSSFREVARELNGNRNGLQS